MYCLASTVSCASSSRLNLAWACCPRIGGPCPIPTRIDFLKSRQCSSAFFFRTGVVVAYVIVAEAVLDVGLGFFSGFIGAIAMTAFSFYLPWLVYWRLCHNRMSVGMKLVCAFWGILGIAMAIAGVVASVQQMSGMAGGIFKFQQSNCGENSFYIGRYSGGNTPKDLRDHGAFSLDEGPGSFYHDYYMPACGGPKVLINCAQISGPTPPVHGTCAPVNNTVFWQ